MFLDFKENIELLEKVILNFILSQDDDDLIIRPKNIELLDKREIIPIVKSYYFLDENIQAVFRVAKKYFKQYNRIPSRSEMKDLLNLENSSMTESQFNDVFNINLREYSYEFLYKYTKAFILFRNLNSSITEMMTEIKTQDITPENIDKVVDKFRSDLSNKLSISLTNTGRGLNFFNPESHIQLAKTGNPTGFEFFDRVLDGGWNPKTLVVFQGRPKVGKTMVLSNVGARAVLRGVNVGVATFELSRSAYIKRIGSNILNIPYKDYGNFIKTTDLNQVNQKLRALKLNNPNIGELFIEEFGTGAASALDVENYFLKIEQQTGKKFKIIIVDYLNIMRPISPKEGMYEKIKTISEELRAVAIRNEWCIITATQVKREAVEDNDLGMADVAESFGLIHTVDTLFGLMRGPMEKIMKIKVIANRDGGYTESYKRYDVIYDYSRLVELTGPADHYYSDEDQTADIEAEMHSQYNNVNNSQLERDIQSLNPTVSPTKPIPIKPIPTQSQLLEELDSMDSLPPVTASKNIKRSSDYDDILNQL